MTGSPIPGVLSEVFRGPLQDPLRDPLRDPKTSQNISDHCPCSCCAPLRFSDLSGKRGQSCPDSARNATSKKAHLPTLHLWSSKAQFLHTSRMYMPIFEVKKVLFKKKGELFLAHSHFCLKWYLIFH